MQLLGAAVWRNGEPEFTLLQDNKKSPTLLWAAQTRLKLLIGGDTTEDLSQVREVHTDTQKVWSDCRRIRRGRGRRRRRSVVARFTFREQGSGRIQVEVPAEKGDKVRGHRNPSARGNPTPWLGHSVTSQDDISFSVTVGKTPSNYWCWCGCRCSDKLQPVPDTAWSHSAVRLSARLHSARLGAVRPRRVLLSASHPSCSLPGHAPSRRDVTRGSLIMTVYGTF